MAASPDPTIDPNKEYSPETMAAMQAVLDANKARKDAEAAEKRRLYKIKVDELVATSEFATVLSKLDDLYNDTDRDNNLFFYVDAARLNLNRLTGN